MISRICARLILIVGLAGMAQVRAGAQATLNATDSQFGSEPTPYSPPAQPVQPRGGGYPVAQPVQGGNVQGGYYAPPGGAYAPQAPQQETATLGAPDPTKPLGRGDTVTFLIEEDREPAQVMRVTDTGELDFSAFPKIGRVSVVGRTCAQVASELKHKLEADYYNSATVELGINQVNLSSSRGRVYLVGCIGAPGPQELPSNERTMLSNAIIRAGSFAKFADQRKVKVTRREKDGKVVRYVVDEKAVIYEGHLDKDLELEDGDYINIPQKLINY